MINLPNLPDFKGKLKDWHTDVIDNRAAQARNMAITHGYDPVNHFDEYNAIEHSYVSAQVTLESGDLAARMLGNIKEWVFSDDPMDSRRDQYNNEVGRRIAQWIELNGLDETAIDALVLDAIQNGKLVTNVNDHRITSQPPQETDWRGPTSWPTPKQQLPEKGPLGQAIEDVKEAFDDVRRWLEDPFADAPDWLRDLRDWVKDILADPLVLDLDGDGIEITSLASSTTMFDMDGDGSVERTAWVSPHDGLLVHDANQNGLADGVGELFGSANVDGYYELATLDSNNDGRIDAADPAFADLRVWRDLNSDGVSTADEMLSLAQAGMTRFNLAYTQADDEVAGNVVARTGTYVRTDGTTRAMASVRFALDETGDLPEIPENALVGNIPILPNLSGYASLPDLATAMFFDPTLKAMVEALVFEARDFETFQDFVDGGFLDVLYRWTGVDTSVPEDPNSPYYHQVFEAVTGLSLADLNAFQRARVAEIWPETLKQLGVNFLFQAAQKPALEPFLEMLDALTALDPTDPNVFATMTTMTEAALAEAETIVPAYDYLELFTGLEFDVGTGEITGDFDAFVERFLEHQPSFNTSNIAGGSMGGGGGGGGGRLTIDGGSLSGGSQDRHPWVAFYEDQGSLLFNIAAAMGIGQDYVLNATGWRWLFGEATTVEGTAGNDLFDLGVSFYTRPAGSSGGSSSVTVTVYDQIVFGYEGDDEIRGNSGVDRLVGGPGADLLKGGSSSDMYVYAAGDGLDRIVEDSGAEDAVYFSSELNSADLRVARLAGTSDLLLHFGDPASGIILTNQWSSSATAVEQIHFVAEDGLDAGDVASLWLATLATAGADTIAGSWAGERIDGLGGNDVLTGADGDDALAGGDGDDSASGGGGNDTVHGDAGADGLTGGSGNDILAGGAGADSVQGGSGADTYVYNLGDGDDWLYDYQSSDSTALDTLIFGAGITPADLVFSRVAADWDDVRISFVGQAGSILLENQNWYDAGIEILIFADGTVWNHAELMARYVADQQTSGSDTIWGSNLADIVEGGAGNDIVNTGGSADTLIGGGGNDTLSGGTGADTYVYNAGDGDDVVNDYMSSDGTALDTLVFGTGIAPADLILSRVAADWDDIRISFAGQAGSVVVDNQNWVDSGIEWVSFADGTIWTLVQLMERYVADQQSAGDDTIWTSNLDDLVDGGAGNDYVVAGPGGDRLIGGTGDDYLNGGTGADTYVYAPGDGHDRIYDYQGSRSNVLEFGEGIGQSDILVSRPQGDSAALRISFKAMAGSVTLLNQTWGDAGIETVRFADGSTMSKAALNALLGPATNGNDSLAGTAGDDVFWALEGADSVSGLGGADTLRGQDGNDVLVGGEGSDQLIGGAGDDILRGDLAGFDVLAAGASLIVNGGFEQVGTISASGSWGRSSATLPGWTRTNSHHYELMLSGYGGVASSEGSYWLDLEGGGGTGSNMVVSQTVSGLAAGQVLILAFDHANRTTAASGGFELWWNGALVLAVTSTGKTMQAKSLELVALAGDNVLTFKGLGTTDGPGASIDNVRLFATQPADSGEDLLDGGEGGDLIDGGAGADLLAGGAGADIFRFDGGDSGLGPDSDRVSDFLPGTDRIDLSAIDAAPGLPGDQAFSFIAGAAFAGVAGQLRFAFDGTDTWLEADRDGDGAADFQIVLAGAVTPTAADFIL